MLKMAVFATALVFGSAAHAGDVLVYTCDAPRGYRADYSAGENIKWETDSFSYVRPTVVWLKAVPGKLFVSWGHSVPPLTENLPGIDRMLKDSRIFKEATVVSRDEHSIQAVYAQCATCSTSLFGLFPTLQLLTMAEASYMGRLSGGITGGVRAFASICRKLG